MSSGFSLHFSSRLAKQGRTTSSTSDRAAAMEVRGGSPWRHRVAPGGQCVSWPVALASNTLRMKVRDSPLYWPDACQILTMSSWETFQDSGGTNSTWSTQYTVVFHRLTTAATQESSATQRTATCTVSQLRLGRVSIAFQTATYCSGAAWIRRPTATAHPHTATGYKNRTKKSTHPHVVHVHPADHLNSKGLGVEDVDVVLDFCI
mmetsp:Transcript_7062/g.17468  ORF Transcript_7062/g.17468 Transcript_7062/m.17468 type:complete len:205 (+) Transcript_7062:994-1608(+)